MCGNGRNGCGVTCEFGCRQHRDPIRTVRDARVIGRQLPAARSDGRFMTIVCGGWRRTARARADRVADCGGRRCRSQNDDQHPAREPGHVIRVYRGPGAPPAGARIYRPAAAISSDWVQNAQRRAAIGTSLKHSGHFFVVGSAGASPRRRRAMIAFIGAMTKK